jgi:hypothetical protein
MKEKPADRIAHARRPAGCVQSLSFFSGSVSLIARLPLLILEFIEANLTGSPILRQMIKGRAQDSIELTNGISIKVRPASFRKLGGPTYVAPSLRRDCVLVHRADVRQSGCRNLERGHARAGDDRWSAAVRIASTACCGTASTGITVPTVMRSRWLLTVLLGFSIRDCPGVSSIARCRRTGHAWPSIWPNLEVTLRASSAWRRSRLASVTFASGRQLLASVTRRSSIRVGVRSGCGRVMPVGQHPPTRLQAGVSVVMSCERSSITSQYPVALSDHSPDVSWQLDIE